jgi:small subunit ribosomal protein S17
MPECNDPRCPVHGSLKVRGNVFTGEVVSAKPSLTIKVERVLFRYVPKYERYRKIRSKVTAHAPDCFKVVEGDKVKIGETRKLSKTKAFVVMEVVTRKEGMKTIKVKAEVTKEKKHKAEEAKPAEKKEEKVEVKEVKEQEAQPEEVKA